MITLEPHALLAGGSDRDCYQHPDNNHRCIKILKDLPGVVKRNKREIDAYKLLTQRNSQPSCLPIFFGSEPTNLGLGFIFELIRNHDGTISPTLNDAKDTIAPQELRLLLKDLYSELHQSAVVVSDLHPGNILLQTAETPSLKLIDGIGNADYIKICNWSKSFARRKLDRKFGKLLKKLDLEMTLS